MENSKDEKKRPQQRTEDPKRQNEKQEREYREQKEGKSNPAPKDEKGEKSTERYADLDTVNKKKLEEE